MSNTERKWHKKVVWCIEEHLIYLMACYLRHVSGYFWIRNLSFLDTASVHMNPVNPAYESATFWIRSPEWKFLNTLWIRNRVDAKSGYIDVTRSSPVLYREYCIQDGNLIPRFSLLPVEGEVGEDPGNAGVHDGCRLAALIAALRCMLFCQYSQRCPGY